MDTPLVGIIMGSDSDWGTMQKCVATLKSFGIPFEAHVMSAHRTPERAARLTAGCDGFAYVITTRGITGERKALPPELADRLAALRTVTDLPLAAGFGIADATMARAVGQHAQGVVIGSAAVRALTEGGLPGLREWLHPFAP